MTKYFVPYSKDIPAAINIKGHTLLLVATAADEIVADLSKLGGDRVQEMILKDSPDEQTAALAALAESIKGGVVLTPPGISVSTMISSLENELPWLH